MDNLEDGERKSPDEVTDQRDARFEIPDEIRYDLKKPFKRVAKADDEVSSISFRPPTVGEMVRVAKSAEKEGDAASALLLITLVNNDKLSAEDIKRINFVDFQICMEKLAPFMELSKRTTKASS